MQITDEELIAYLLGNAPAPLVSRIRQAMTEDASLGPRLVHLRFVVGQIDSLGSIYEAPADLIESTMTRIDEESTPLDSPPEPASKYAGRLSGARAAPKTAPSWWDSSVLSLCLAAICCLILPAVVRARHEARRIQCAQNLRFIGQNLQDFAELDPGGRFPQVCVDGPEAFSGVFVLRLASAGMPIASNRLLCPSLIGMPTAFSCDPPPVITNRNELFQLTAEELWQYQQRAAGNWAYSLGVLEDGRVVAPKFDGRSQFAILADAPMIDGDQEQLIAHGGRGINIFYEDGRVAFVSLSALANSGSEFGDDPLRNLHNTHEAGLTPQDASLAPSYFPPLSR